MDKNKNAELSGKYCSRLGADVMVISGVDGQGNERHTCLSSHLCRCDERKSCGTYHDENKNNQNIN